MYIIGNIKKGKNLSSPCDFEFPYYLQMIWFNQAENQSGGLIDILQDHWKTKVIVISPSLSLIYRSNGNITEFEKSRLDITRSNSDSLFFFIAYFFSSQRGSYIVTPLNSDGSVDINIINKTDSTKLFELMVGEK